jgi:hypothetical protein
MKAIQVFIDGTICDTRPRHLPGIGTPEFYQDGALQGDIPVPGSVECLVQLAQHYQIVYIGARPPATLPATEKWLERHGFPKGPVYLAETQLERLQMTRDLKAQFDFTAGIGDRWDDNELHTELGCLSIILEEYAGAWPQVFARVRRAHRDLKIRQNQIHLRGKVEGLARVMPLLQSRFGEAVWDAWMQAVLEMAASSRDERRQEDLALFAKFGLDPGDLRDAASLDDLLREADWESNPVYGLQSFELVEATPNRYVHKVTRCYYAELWKACGKPDIGYHIHCQTDQAWWDRPAWNPDVRFEQPKTLMRGDDCCVFIQYLGRSSTTGPVQPKRSRLCK